MEQLNVVVVGGGITGLVTAYRLSQWQQDARKTGHPIDIQCIVCEQEEYFGGKINTAQSDGLLIETGPDSIFTRNPAAVDLIRDLGLEGDIVHVAPVGGAMVWHDNRLQPLPLGFHTGVPSDIFALVSTELLSIAGKHRALEDLFKPGNSLEQDVSLGIFLRDRLGDELVDVIATPLLAGIHAGDIDNMSLDANMPILRKWYDTHQSLIAGALEYQHQFSDGRAVTKPTFISLRGGLIQLIESLVCKLQGSTDLRLMTRATSIHKTINGSYEVTVESKGETSIVAADAVIITTPAHVASELLKNVEVPQDVLTKIRYVSTATVTFVYNDLPELAEIRTTGFLIPHVEGCSITACTIVSNKWPHVSPFGQVLLRCYVGRDGCEESALWSDEELIVAVREDVRKTLGITKEPNHILVKRWSQAMPQYDVGHKERVDTIDRELGKHPGLFVAGAAYRGVGIPDCVSDAGRMVDKLKNHFGERR